MTPGNRRYDKLPDIEEPVRLNCRCGFVGWFIYAGSYLGKRECPRCGRYSDDAR